MTWLRADLDAWDQLAEKDAKARSTVTSTLRRWQQDRDLASLRDPDAIAELPVGEQEECKKFWTAVEALLQKIQARE